MLCARLTHLAYPRMGLVTLKQNVKFVPDMFAYQRNDPICWFILSNWRELATFKKNLLCIQYSDTASTNEMFHTEAFNQESERKCWRKERAWDIPRGQYWLHGSQLLKNTQTHVDITRLKKILSTIKNNIMSNINEETRVHNMWLYSVYTFQRKNANVPVIGSYYWRSVYEAKFESLVTIEFSSITYLQVFHRSTISMKLVIYGIVPS